EDGEGRIEYDGVTLAGGRGGRGSRLFYDNPDAPDYVYAVDGEPSAGPVTLTITRIRGGGHLTVFDFSNGDLGIQLEEEARPGRAPAQPPRPAAPALNPGNANRGDPLVIDLVGTGIQTWGLDKGLHFDHDGDRFAERTGWIAAGGGLLVLDADADGVLDDGQELFGDFTRLAGGQLAVNGFAALSQYDRNRDGLIDARDPVWQRLRVAVWERAPRGGAVAGDPHEAMGLRRLDELGIAAISLDSAIVNAAEANGNTKTRKGRITLQDGTAREIAEYRFVRDNAETRFLDWRPLPAEIAVLPELILGGVQMDLSQALVRDAQEGWLGHPPGRLREKLDAFLAETDPAVLHARFEALLFAWTGAEAIPAGTTTNQLDARHAQVLEKAYGRSFQNPNADQAVAWQLTYERLAEGLYASLLARTHLAPFYEAIVWNHSDATGRAFGDLGRAEALLEAALADDPARGRALVNEFGRLLRGLGLARDTTYFALRERFMNGGDPALAFEFDAAGKPPQTPEDGQPLGPNGKQFSGFTQAVRASGNTSLYGHGGDDVLYGGPDGTRLVGGPGGNVLYGDAGDDHLWAHEGDDVLDGGAGDDLLKGGSGDDAYLFRRGSGVDTIEESGGNDMVFFGGGLTRADIFARRNNAGGYEIGITGTGDLLKLPSPAAFGGGVERFLFSDGSLFRLIDLFRATEGNDFLYGEAGQDLIDALGGDDRIEGGEGNDVLLGNAGDDVLVGGSGDDVLDGGPGDDLLAATNADAATAGSWTYRIGRGNGNDTYRFGFGDGHDLIVDADSMAGNVDTIVLKEGVMPADVTLRAEGWNLVLVLSSGDTLRVRGHFRAGGAEAVERILFADGTVWSGSLLRNPVVQGTPGDDVLHALPDTATRLVGLGGSDRLFGSGGNDSLEGGEGNDRLSGGYGDDVLRGGEGNDVLEGGPGSDVYDGGAGDDLLKEGDTTSSYSPGADVFLFGRGDGHDRIVSRRVYAYDWWMPRPVTPYGGAAVRVDDVVRFKPGVSPADVTVVGMIEHGAGYDYSAGVRVEIAGDPAASLTIDGFLNGYADGGHYTSSVRRFEFADGTVWNYEDIADRMVWRGTAGDDERLWGSEYDDRIHGFAGNDVIAGFAGNDTIDAGEGDDVVYAGDGDDTVFGGEGNDLIDPGDGNDLVDGGAGDDRISSRYAPWLIDRNSRYPVLRRGDLTVLFGRGDGRDVIEITSQRSDSNDVIRLKEGVAPADVKLVREGDDLLLRLADAGDSLRVRHWFAAVTDAAGDVSHPFRVERIAFADGTQWGVAEIRAAVLIGTEAGEVLSGYDDADDLIEGRGGDDVLRGGAGDDTYVFRRGDGRDVVVDVSGNGVIHFADRLPSEIGARRVGDDLLLEGDADRVTVSRWFGAASGGIGAVRFADGSAWDARRLRELVLTGTPGPDVLTGYAGGDVLEGMGGDDVLAGGTGDDTYVFRRGDGRDVIREAGGIDTLHLADLLPDEVEVRAENLDLVVAVKGGAGESGKDEVRLAGWFGRDSTKVERIVFADGSEMDAEEMLELASRVSDSDDYLPGTPGDDLIDGRGGDDTILGLDGDDVLVGGRGGDSLAGGNGRNEYRLGRGDGFDRILTTPSRSAIFPQLLERAELELALLDGSDEDFRSDFWEEGLWLPEAYRIPSELRDPLTYFIHGVSAEEARAALMALRAWLLGGEDTIVLGEGIRPADLTVQYGFAYGGEINPTPMLAVGFGSDEGFLLRSEKVLEDGEGGASYEGTPALQRIRFADGTEWSLDELLARAEAAVIGEQYGSWWDDVLTGSIAPDAIHGGEGHDRIDAGGQNDLVYGDEGEDIIFGGSGADRLYGGPDADLLIGGAGADQLAGGPGSDVYAYNRGDGADLIDNSPGLTEGDADALSFGGGILEADVTAWVTPAGRLVLHTGASEDTLSLDWFDPEADFAIRTGQTLALAQFIHRDGMVRVYDLARLIADRRADLLAASEESPFALFGDAGAYDVTADWSAYGVALGGQAAMAYALSGDAFVAPFDIQTDGSDDAIAGSVLDDYIDAGDGDNRVDAGEGNDTIRTGDGRDRIDGGAGNDVLTSGAGDDVVLGGPGDDFIDAGPGNDRVEGGAGNDRYHFRRADGMLSIDDRAQPDAGNSLYLDGIVPSDITLSAEGGEFVIRVNDDGGEVRLSNFDPSDPYAGHAVARYEFSDGSAFGYEELLRLGLRLDGTGGPDILVGAAGDDFIAGHDGDDLIEGGRGADVLVGGAGGDTYVFNPGDGEDTLIDRESPFAANVLRFGPGIVPAQIRLRAEGADLILEYGEAGDAIRMPGVRSGETTAGAPFGLLRFADGSSVTLAELLGRGMEISGTPDDDVLVGTEGEDLLRGLEGTDVLAGGPGNDVYLLAPGCGIETIRDVTDSREGNTLRLAFPGLESPDGLQVSWDRAAGALTIRVRGSEDGAVLAGFDPDDPLGSSPVDRIEFAGSGRSITLAELLARGIEILGSEGDDVLTGTAARDLIRGMDGDDLIQGGRGGDVAEGGAGNDTYVFNRGDGVLTIREAASESPGNALVFGAGISLADIRNNLRFVAPDAVNGVPGWLRIGIGSSGDEVWIEGFDPEDAEIGPHGVEHFLFDDGTQLGYRDLVLNTFIIQGDEDDNALAGSSVQDRLYGYEGNDELRGGAGNDTLTGGKGDDLLVGGAGADMYVFDSGDGHDVILDSAADYEASQLVFVGGIGMDGIEVGRDGADLLIRYGENDSVRIANWLPERAGLWSVRTADGVSKTLAEALNRAPTAAGPLPDATAMEDRPFTHVLPAGAFGDPEGGGLAYRAELADGHALPFWLAFDPVARAFYGTPENEDVGMLDVVVRATDEHGASAAESLRIEVVNTNDAPEVAIALADQQATEDAPFSFTVPEGAFRDVDAGDVLTLSARRADGSALPAWLAFDAATRTFSGLPANDHVGNVSIRLTATDAAGAQASQTFAIAVANTNDAPQIGVPLSNQSGRVGEPVSWQLPTGAFFDVDAGDALTYSATLASGSALPGWLTFDAATGTFSGTPTAAGSVQLQVTATDLAGAQAHQRFAFEAAAGGGNLPPVTAPDTASVSEDCKLITWGNVLANDRDPEGSSLSVTDAGIRRGEYGWLKLLPDGSYAYVLDNAASKVQGLAEGETVTDRFAYTASDGTATSSGELAVTVSGNNDAPVLARKLADVQLAKGRAFSWQLPAGSFTDRDRNDALSYTATLANGK
ncbi:MAG: putative Ig domain-containing protein, partial [Caenispirillum sp.]|nr:putative Ig domain-containing protein [Caenispirillum sp.]